MMTLLQINKAINDKIKIALADTEFSNVPIVAEDLSEPIIRPSIKTTIETTKNGKFNSRCREKNLVCKIYYFAENRNKYKIENSKVQDLLENEFLEDLQVGESFYIPILEVESDITDTILVCSFDLYAVELITDTDASEPMEDLIFEI